MSIKIHKSYDYNDFSNIKFNRTVCKKNLEKLIELNVEKDRFHLFPIVVDVRRNIIDGQHRFEACKQLGKPIYYVVDAAEGEHWDSITKVNTAGKTHSATDVYYMLLKKKDKWALKIDMVKNYYPEIPVGSLCNYFLNRGKKSSVLRLLQTREHHINDFDLKLEVLESFIDNYGYFRAPQGTAILTMIRKLNIKKINKYFKMLKSKGFLPDRQWAVSTFKESLVKAHNKGLHKNRIAL